MNFAGHVVNALAPVADAFAGATVNTDVIDAQGGGVLFIIHMGVNAGGASTVTVEACDNTTPSTTTTIPFVYRSCTTGDTWGAWTAATTAGFTSSTASNAMHQIWVDPAELAEEGYQYVRLDLAESTDAAVLAGILAIVMDPRYQVQPSSLID